MSRPPDGYQPEFEVIYRDQLASHVQTVGRVAGAANPHGAIEVTVTQQTAARFGLQAGSLVTVKGPSGPVLLLITAVVRERDPAGTFWTADPLAAAPELTEDAERSQYSLKAPSWRARASWPPYRAPSARCSAFPATPCNWTGSSRSASAR